MARTTFHRVAIGGIDFEAHLSADGPYLSATRGGRVAGGVPLGYAARVSDLGLGAARRPGPWVCKHGVEPRIFLDGFGQAEFDALRSEFGIGRFSDVDFLPFSETRAWVGLVEFVRSHPKIASRNGHYESYLNGWHDKARAQIGLGLMTKGHRRYPSDAAVDKAA